MSKNCKNSNPLQREGTTQIKRLLYALIPENVKLHDLTTEDWLAFAKDYATLINYYKLESAQLPHGDWEDFFVEKDEIKELLKSFNDGNIEPHMALFIAFLKLLVYPQLSLNRIPKRHLDYYYSEVLQLYPKEFSPDTVHVIFELAKNATSELIESDSKLEAGKDGEGNSLHFSMNNDFVANQAKISSLKSMFTDNNGHLKYASQSDTADGISEALEGDLSWSAFGDSKWPLVPLELYLSSDILLMKEGNRNLTITWEFNKKLEISGSITAYLTGEKDWLDGVNVQVSGTNNNIWKLTIPEDEKEVFPFDGEIHQANINTKLAVLKFSFTHSDIYKSAKDLTITSVQIDVDVQGVQNLIIENELGTQLPDKPFMPFGPRPKKNSAFTIESPEFSDKDIKTFKINMAWLNMPANFSKHYSHYSAAIAAQKKNESNNAGYSIGHSSIHLYDYEHKVADDAFDFVLAPFMEKDSMREEYELQVSSPFTANPSSHKMFTPTQPIVNVIGDKTNKKGGEIEIRLQQSFYHDLFNNIYVSIISSANGGAIEPEELPNQPYTPLLDYISLDYTASAKITFADDSVSSQDISLLQSGPFGTKLISERDGLFPKILTNQLFIGLSDCVARDNISLLFQVSEGSENPHHSSFKADEKIKWSVLTDDDQWFSLEETSILSNNTNNFLKPGIVEISLPKNTGLKHYLLDDELIWLRIELPKQPDSVSRFIGVHTQAAPASFNNNDNSLEHLYSGLAAETIKQLSNRKAKVKSISQPYPSFDGKPTEEDDDFYRRVSERLRHKDRALSIWDYERLVLQEYPRIYKVKCLNHTRLMSTKVCELSPSYVSLVVIPKLSDSNTAFRLTPTVSQNTKDEIKKYLLPRHGLHVNLEVLNPIYEKVRLAFKVKFYAQYDYNYYRIQIDEDIVRFMAPWVYDADSQITFDQTLYIYDVINYLENLEYVDYIEDFKMFHFPFGKGWKAKNDIKPSNAMAVLVPNQTHDISESTICPLP